MVVTAVEQKVVAVAERVEAVVVATEQAIRSAERASRHVGWRTAGVIGSWTIDIGVVLVAFVWWKGLAEIRERVAVYSRLEVDAAAVKQQIGKAQLAECRVGATLAAVACLSTCLPISAS